MSGNGALDFHPSMQCTLVSCKCNHFCPPPSLFLSFLHHTQFWSQRISQQVWFLLHSFSSCLPLGTLQLVGNQGVLFLVSEGIFLFFPISDEWRLSSNADANGNAQPSSLAAKGYRSVHPNLPSDKPQVGVYPRVGCGLVNSACF